jgi:hypothetical protein
MVMTIKWDEEAGMHFYMCGLKKQYVRLEDADGNEMKPETAKESEDDKRTTDLQQL